MRRFVLIVVLVSLVAVLAKKPSAQTVGDLQEGHQLAVQKCAVCHVVASDQLMPPVFNTAQSFQRIANRPTATAASLHNFLQITHTTIAEPASMPYPNLSNPQVTNIVAYILSLRATTPPAKIP